MADLMQQARELLHCPFCGSADSEMQQAQTEHYVECLECEASTALLSTRREARELWNRRAALRAAPEGYVLVPVEPTPEMLMAAGSAVHSATYWKTAWAAMLAARPQEVRDAG